MDIRKALVVKCFRELPTIMVCLKYPRGGEIEYKFAVEGTIEKLQRIVRSRKIRSTVYTESSA